MENLDKDLGICSYCKAIRINDEKKVWLTENVNSDLYNQFMKKYDGKLTHGICPECMQKHYPECTDDNLKEAKNYIARNPKSDGLAEKIKPTLDDLEIPREFFE